MGVELSVLGPLVARVDGRPVGLGGPRQRSVLARLAVAGGAVVSTDRLLEDVWSGEQGARTPASLQVAISHLRRALEPERAARAPARVLVSAAPGYALALDAVRVDAEQAAGLLERARDEEPSSAVTTLRAAVALWRGPAYAEFADAEWAEAEAGRLDEMLLIARERLAAAELACGRHEDVVLAMSRHVRRHPLREEAVRLLALALHRGGRAPEALEVLRASRARLREELGLDLGPELAALEVDILGPADPPVTPVETSRAPRRTDAETVLGRDAELGRLQRRADRARAGAADLVLVGGEAGAGKTALLDELTGRLTGQGWTSVRGRCPEVEGAPPAWAWTEVARGLPPGSTAGEPADPSDPTGGHTVHRGQAIADALGRLAARHPVLVTLDDLHRADDETLRLLRVVVAAAPRRVLVLGTYRPDEAGPGSALEATFAALASVVGDRLTLPGLPTAAVGALLGRHGLTVDAATVAEVVDRTGGNPLFVREVARLGSAEPGAAIPDGVRDVLRRRVATLPGSARSVLGHVALFGRDVEVEVLLGFERAVTDGAGEDDALDALEAAVTAGVLDEPADGRVRFGHDLWREVLHADLPRLRRARLHAVALEVLETAPGPANPAALAHHALAAGDRVEPDRRHRHLVSAAEQAVARGAFRRAVELWRAAVDAATSAGLGVHEVLELRCGLISALARAGADGSAWAERDAALAAAAPLAAPELAARILTCADAPTPWPNTLTPGRQLVALDALLDPERPDRWRPDPRLRARLLVASAFESEWVDPARSDEHSRLAVEAARALGDGRLLCAALGARHLASVDPDHWHRIDALGTEMLAVATAEGHEDYRAEAHHLLFTAANLREDLDTAQAHADAALACATDGQLDTTFIFAGVFAAGRALVEGRLDDATRIYHDDTERLIAIGATNAGPTRAAGLFAVGYARGDTSPAVGPMGELYAYVPRRCTDMYALTLLDAGRIADARRAWLPEVAPTRDLQWLGWNRVRADVAIRLGHREVAESARRALEPWSGWKSIAGSGSLAFGPVDLGLARLARFLGRPEPERHRYLDVAERTAAPSAPWLAQVAAERAIER